MEKIKEIWGHIVVSFQTLYYIAMYGLIRAEERLEKEKKTLKEELSKMKLMVDITPGVCGDDSHAFILEGPEEGMTVIGETTYHWYGGCPRCVAEKLEELKNVTKNQKR